MTEWRRVRLKHLAAEPIRNGLGEAGAYDDPSWPRYIRTTDIERPRRLRDDTFASLPPDIARKADLRRGDIVMTAAGTIGKSLLYQLDAPACYAGYLVRFRSRPDVDARYVSYWTESHPYWAQIEADRVVSTIENFSASRYQNLELLLPSQSRQRAIADFLDTETARIDALVMKKHRMIDLAESRYISFIDTLMQQSALGPLAGLGRFVTSLTQGVSPQADSEPAAKGAWGVLKLNAVKKGAYVPEENKALPSGYIVEPTSVPVIGDLLVTRANTPAYVGDVCVVDVEASVVVPDLIYRLQLDGRLDPRFAALALLSSKSRWHLASAARGTSQSMVKLRGEDIRGTPVPMASATKQRETVIQAGQAELERSRLVDRLTRQIRLLQEHRQALITAAVTGELDFPGMAA